MIKFLDKIIHREKFPAKLFVVASIASLFLFGILFLFLKVNYLGIKEDMQISANNDYDITAEQTDPFITKVPTLKDAINKPIINSKDPSIGSPNTKINIIIFSDYECAYCQKVENILKSMAADYQDKVRIIRKDYPENKITSFSWRASLAARCAAEQGRFWDYHDQLFVNNSSLDPDLFLNLADELNLDKSAFEKCLQDKNISQLVSDNIVEAQALDIVGVPFIYINDREIMGEINSNELKKMIESELAK
ncbi:MAG: thioredoxin domain-containing protein [Patescibacteria group bacterium]|nr:thioredoxin domain-containing protein [Patescibacteria group bacterium]